jgi:hypothetical protein
MSDVGICRFLRSSILLVCMASLTLVVITMRGVEILGMCSYCVYLVHDNGIGALNSPSRGKCTLEKHSTFPNASLALPSFLLHVLQLYIDKNPTPLLCLKVVLVFFCLYGSMNSRVKVNSILLVRSSVRISGSFCLYAAPCIYI